MNYVLSRLLGRSVAVLVLAVAAPSLAFADLNQEAKLSPSLNAGALAGNSVAISDDGSVAVVGAPGDEAAYVYTRVGLIWTKVATLTANDNVVGDHFGASVSISGDGVLANIAVGAPDRSSGAGAVYLFSGAGLIWAQNPNSLTSSLTSAGHLGTSVSIQGFRIAAGAPNSTAGRGANAGVAIVFDSNDLGVTYTRSTFRPNGGQARVGGLFGTSVSLSGNTVLVGAPGYHTGTKLNSGNVFVFVNNGGAYTQQASIRPANVADNFSGTAVSLFNDTAAFGAPGANNGKGAVYVYNRTGTAWALTATVANPGNTAGEGFGSSVAQLGPFLVAGAPGANSNNGAAYEFGGTNYPVINQLVPNPAQAAGANFGFSTSVNSGRTLVGAPADDAAGSAYVFKFLVPSVTKITSTSVDPGSASTGVGYTVNVKVDHDIGGIGTPTGSVHVDDGAGGSCDAALDGLGNGNCDVTSNFFGFVTLTATYNGDLTFSPSQDGRQLLVTGNHLVFNPAPPADVLQGTEFVGTVEVRNGADAVITSDNTTQVTLTVQDSCGNPNTIGTVTVVNGVATFSTTGPKFYTVVAGLDISAAPEAGNDTAIANSSVNVVTNTDILFADGYDDCRL
jgi:FG-GAP repeat